VLSTVTLDASGPEEVLVRSEYGGAYRADYHFAAGEWTMPAPLSLRHEGAGAIEDVELRVTTLTFGDHVFSCWTLPTHRCRYCISG
jgi:alcohol dehydrogenase